MKRIISFASNFRSRERSCHFGGIWKSGHGERVEVKVPVGAAKLCVHEWAWVWAYVCVCVREREREGARCARLRAYFRKLSVEVEKRGAVIKHDEDSWLETPSSSSFSFFSIASVSVRFAPRLKNQSNFSFQLNTDAAKVLKIPKVALSYLNRDITKLHQLTLWKSNQIKNIKNICIKQIKNRGSVGSRNV